MKNLNNLCAYPINRPQAGSLGLLVQSLPLQASISFPASGWKCVLRGSASKADKLRQSLRIIAPTQSMGAS